MDKAKKHLKINKIIFYIAIILFAIMFIIVFKALTNRGENYWTISGLREHDFVFSGEDLSIGGYWNGYYIDSVNWWESLYNALLNIDNTMDNEINELSKKVTSFGLDDLILLITAMLLITSAIYVLYSNLITTRAHGKQMGIMASRKARTKYVVAFVFFMIFLGIALILASLASFAWTELNFYWRAEDNLPGIDHIGIENISSTSIYFESDWIYAYNDGYMYSIYVSLILLFALPIPHVISGILYKDISKIAAEGGVTLNNSGQPLSNKANIEKELREKYSKMTITQIKKKASEYFEESELGNYSKSELIEFIVEEELTSNKKGTAVASTSNIKKTQSSENDRTPFNAMTSAGFGLILSAALMLIPLIPYVLLTDGVQNHNGGIIDWPFVELYAEISLLWLITILTSIMGIVTLIIASIGYAQKNAKLAKVASIMGIVTGSLAMITTFGIMIQTSFVLFTWLLSYTLFPAIGLIIGSSFILSKVGENENEKSTTLFTALTALIFIAVLSTSIGTSLLIILLLFACSITTIVFASLSYKKDGLIIGSAILAFIFAGLIAIDLATYMLINIETLSGSIELTVRGEIVKIPMMVFKGCEIASLIIIGIFTLKNIPAKEE